VDDRVGPDPGDPFRKSGRSDVEIPGQRGETPISQRGIALEEFAQRPADEPVVSGNQ
jgi:hypothetical protein